MFTIKPNRSLWQAGLYILQLMDNYAVPYSALFISLFEVLALAWAYGIDRHMANIKKMMGYRLWPEVYWKYQFKYGLPVMILTLIALVIYSIEPFKYNDYEFPEYTEYVGWGITLSSVIMIPLFACFELFTVFTSKKTYKVSVDGGGGGQCLFSNLPPPIRTGHISTGHCFGQPKDAHRQQQHQQ